MDSDAIREHIKRAIRIAGSEKKLGELVGRSQHAIWSAKELGRVTAELAVRIERATEGQVSRFDLKPDLFGADAPLPEDRASA